MNAANEFDLGPLIWVKGEIDLALSRAADALEATRRKSCRDRRNYDLPRHICTRHMVRWRSSASTASPRYPNRSKRCSATWSTDAQRPPRCCLTSGSRASPCCAAISTIWRTAPRTSRSSCLPIYEQVQRARNAAPAVPSDLFFPDLSLRPPKREMATRRTRGRAVDACC
ncbi:MAG: hypothetical protein MZW92_63860 [Comamonadaceae bacterium]|nr:hypothetical protein [Comamonadaceae bacterium]